MADDNKDNSENTDISIDDRETQVTATVSLNSVFTLLHEKAYKEAQSKFGNIEIVNSAVNDKGKFLGAGQHVIIAQPKDGNLIKVDCLNAIKEYVHWFSGPDVEETITLDSLTPLTRPQTDEEKNTILNKDQDNKESEDKEKNKEEDSESKEENSKDEDKNVESDEQQKEANESLETYIYQIDNNLFNIIFESTQNQDEEAANSKGLKITGYQVQYTLDIPGQKTNAFVNVIKNLGKYFGKGLLNQIGGIGFQTWDWRTGAKGETHTLGDMAKKLVKRISPDKLVNAVKEEFSKKFPDNSIELTILNSKSIVNHLSKRLPSGDKGKILKIPYALCIKVDKNDKNYELVNKKAIVKFVKSGLSKIKENLINLNFKTWQKITENDVILVNNYNDQHYNPDAAKHGQADADANVGISNESVKNVFDIYKIIFENIDLSDVEKQIVLLLEDTNSNEESSEQNTEGVNSEKNSTELEDKDINDISEKIKEFYTNSNLIKQKNIKDKLIKFKKNETDKLTKAIAEILATSDNGNIDKDLLSNKLKGINFNELIELRDNTKNYLQNFETKINNFENTNADIEALKKNIMLIKYLYIKNKINELIDNKLLNNFYGSDIKFNNIDTNSLDKVDININNGEISDDDYKNLSNKIQVSNKETKQFENYTDNQFEELITNLQSDEVKNALKELEEKEKKDKEAADSEGNKRALDKTKTGKDMYIIPIAGINFEDKK